MTLILDATGSVTVQYETVQALAREIVQGLSFVLSRVRVAVVTYQVEATIQFDLDDYADKVCWRVCMKYFNKTVALLYGYPA